MAPIGQASAAAILSSTAFSSLTSYDFTAAQLQSTDTFNARATTTIPSKCESLGGPFAHLTRWHREAQLAPLVVLLLVNIPVCVALYVLARSCNKKKLVAEGHKRRGALEEKADQRAAIETELELLRIKEFGLRRNDDAHDQDNSSGDREKRSSRQSKRSGARSGLRFESESQLCSGAVSDVGLGDRRRQRHNFRDESGRQLAKLSAVESKISKIMEPRMTERVAAFFASADEPVAPRDVDLGGCCGIVTGPLHAGVKALRRPAGMFFLYFVLLAVSASAVALAPFAINAEIFCVQWSHKTRLGLVAGLWTLYAVTTVGAALASWQELAQAVYFSYFDSTYSAAAHFGNGLPAMEPWHTLHHRRGSGGVLQLPPLPAQPRLTMDGVAAAPGPGPSRASSDRAATRRDRGRSASAGPSNRALPSGGGRTADGNGNVPMSIRVVA